MTIPILLVGGFLGAGKTTLMRRLIFSARERGLRAAVVVNEFSSQDIDSNILREASDGSQASAELLASIAGGCACCSGQDELHWALMEIAAQERKPDVILLEASGMADPVVLLEVLTAPQMLSLLRIGALVSVADVTRLSEKIGVPSQRQLQLSDWVILNKADLADEATLVRAESLVRDANPQAHIERASHCEFDLAALWKSVESTPVKRRTLEKSHGAQHASAQTVVCPLPHPIERARLEAALQGLNANVWRAKGFVRVRGEAGLFLVQFTGGEFGGRYTIAPFYLGQDEPQTALVFIGASLDRAALMRDFAGIGNLLQMM